MDKAANRRSGCVVIVGFPRGFTLIELLVVVAIIGLLISVLLPSLNQARRQAKAAVCGSNMRSVGQAVAGYQAENMGAFPASYEYMDGSKQISQIVLFAAGGYWHWSHALTQGGQVGDNAFGCPEIGNNGLPRTNPGPNGGDWEDSPVPNHDDNGSRYQGPDALTDRQVPRLAIAANAALMPRNKWTTIRSGGVRVNRYVRDNQIKYSSEVILATEFARVWTAASGVPRGGGGASTPTCKSHRPINPFFSGSTGYDEYQSPSNVPYRYTQTTGGTDNPFQLYGLYSDAELEQQLSQNASLFDQPNRSEVNAVGRNHPGGNRFSATTNFLFADGHVDRNTVLWSMDNRKWGDKYYSITGNNKVADFDGVRVTSDPSKGG